MYYIFFIYSSTDEHLGCFHTLAIVSDSAENMDVLSCQNPGSISSEQYTQKWNRWIIW